ncbi:HNH endonuclease [Lactobacillus sp. ESL0233]|uniref:HNH endonuclease n=1 Tax=Lactobacillus sp. ESL0233 TaxID=2069354 RepID=UPI0013148AB6|nr:HNH endonuclease [Lactobacillus sp. ESL0233]
MKITCIFCGKEKESSREHIIPNAICANNPDFITENVCKDCNSQLGATIDSKFVNSPQIEFKRAALKQKGHKGDYPQPLKHVTDSDGTEIIFDHNFESKIIPRIKKIDENNYTVLANSEKEADKIAQKKAIRLNQKYQKTSVTEINKSRVNICIRKNLDTPYFEVEFLKIAFEYINTYYADTYRQDPTGNNLKTILNQFKSGNKVNYSDYIEKVSLKKDIPLFNKPNKTYHVITAIPDPKGKLWIGILLYNGIFSYRVLVSNNKDRYPKIISKSKVIDIS